jgi:hypothetical protein
VVPIPYGASLVQRAYGRAEGERPLGQNHAFCTEPQI